MNNKLSKVSILMACISLGACASMSHQNSDQLAANNTSTMTKQQGDASNMQMAENNPSFNGTDIGGALRRAMDENDRSKLSHALDKAPGKQTHWINHNSNVAYTVVPTHAYMMNGTTHCRKYTITAEVGAHTKTNAGTACVDADGSWKSPT